MLPTGTGGSGDAGKPRVTLDGPVDVIEESIADGAQFAVFHRLAGLSHIRAQLRVAAVQ